MKYILRKIGNDVLICLVCIPFSYLLIEIIKKLKKGYSVNGWEIALVIIFLILAVIYMEWRNSRTDDTRVRREMDKNTKKYINQFIRQKEKRLLAKEEHIMIQVSHEKIYARKQLENGKEKVAYLEPETGGILAFYETDTSMERRGELLFKAKYIFFEDSMVIEEVVLNEKKYKEWIPEGWCYFEFID